MQVGRAMLAMVLPLAIVACNRTAPANNGASAANASGNAAAPAAAANSTATATAPR